MKTMKVAMYYNNNDVRIEEMPVPKINEDELLVKVIASGICGSDVMEWYRIKKAPLVLGHEIAGVVHESSVPEIKPGNVVTTEIYVSCDRCWYCRRGSSFVRQSVWPTTCTGSTTSGL